jgi:hypothetical protein
MKLAIAIMGTVLLKSLIFVPNDYRETYAFHFPQKKILNLSKDLLNWVYSLILVKTVLTKFLLSLLNFCGCPHTLRRHLWTSTSCFHEIAVLYMQLADDKLGRWIVNETLKNCFCSCLKIIYTGTKRFFQHFSHNPPLQPCQLQVQNNDFTKTCVEI